MPALNSITLPDGVTYDFEAQAVNREVVPVITEYSGQETTFNALEVTEDSTGHTLYNINNPIGNPILQWIYDGSNEVLGINGDVSIGGLLNAYGGAQFNNGGLYFDNATALPQQTNGNTYNVLVFDAFSAGGRVKFAYASYAATASRIVSRNASGDVCARYFNTSCNAENPASYTSYTAFIDSNGYLRKSSLANFKTWFGSANKATYAQLNYLGYTSSSTAKNFTINELATEIVIGCKFSADNTHKMFCTSVPRNLLEGTYGTKYEVWIGGGKNTSATGNSGAARVLVNVSLASATVVTVQGVEATSGSTNYLSSAYFYVYQR